jgi:DNA-directed RNA polymerase II subunit RPB4
VRKTLSRYGLAEFELCTSDEASALVPSLRSGGRFIGDPGKKKIDKMLCLISALSPTYP